MNLLRRTLLSLLLVVFIAVLSIGLMNTYLGVNSPAGNWVSRATDYVSTLFDSGRMFERLPERLPVRPEAVTEQLLAGPFYAQISDHADLSLDGIVSLCALPVAIPGDEGPDVTIYSWVDEDGVQSFSDEAPQGRSADIGLYRAGHAEFKVNITTEGVHVNDLARGQIVAGAKRIYDYWSKWLGSENLIRSHLNVKVMGDSKRYSQAYGSKSAPRGFYRHSTNEAVVYFDSRTMPTDRLLAVAFHEISHLILARHLGQVPPWYNEGIAMYFGTMSVKGQAASFRQNPHVMRLIKASGHVALDSLVAESHQSWYAGDSAQRYASAGLLIEFLQSTDMGRNLLRALAKDFEAKRCQLKGSRHPVRFQAYAGGRARLSADWEAWLRGEVH